MNRREFIGTIAGAAATTVIDPAFAVSPANKGMMWAFLVHFGFNNWYDTPLDEAPKDAKPHYLTRCMADHVRFDEELWKEVSPQLPKAGINTVIIDLGEFMKSRAIPNSRRRGRGTGENAGGEEASGGDGA